MREPEAAVLSGRLLQAHKDLGSVGKATDGVGMTYATAWRRLQKQGQPCVYKERRLGCFSPIVDMAAYDLLGEYTAARAAVQLCKDGRMP